MQVLHQNHRTTPQAAGKPVEPYTSPSDNHNINGILVTAVPRKIAFFDKRNRRPTLAKRAHTSLRRQHGVSRGLPEKPANRR